MARAEWFDEARFGMFLHWGLYSIPARHEWVKQREELDDDHYDRYFRHFNPDLYDPADWAAQAKAAGMKYVVLTSKHHDGFCLWPSALTDYSVENTPYGRDLIGPYVDALRAEGLKVGLYYSLIDWHHPGFTIDGIHPQSNDEEAKREPRDWQSYVDYLHGQVRELLTTYGQIDYLFFDFSYNIFRVWNGKGPDDWQSERLLAMVRELQPNILVNERLGIPGDFITPEQFAPSNGLQSGGEPVRWQGCHTFSGSWGYDRDNFDWKSSHLLTTLLIDTVSKGGNLLLNVGPNARGEFEPRAVDRLAAMGKWMRLHSRAIYGAGASELTPPPDSRYTQRGDRLYLHIFEWPLGRIHLPDLAGKVEHAQFLHDGSEVVIDLVKTTSLAHMDDASRDPGVLTLLLPIHRPDVEVPVVEIFLRS
ncbi:alpha-L-fucosidase [Microbacterium sp.]|uniref:alpha-L-fucosidase n=1 Tax=Microbacterium sp. TaxID=51671 RepID=UPI003F6F180F